ncbi:MAG: manganese-binding transcriptional regulator MntR [Phycisphaeraceae bacterium]|nr:manganese-binding transcriptional regulator MntR [Phycisphaerales bacterium]MCB9860573.1 manganese-binding transcriptional regulator MntR [Phycisphaeraceae bacterium]
MPASERSRTLRPTPDGHAQVRRAHSSELTEDYVEAIHDIIESRTVCKLVDLARHFGVSHVTVNKAIGRLVRDGLVRTMPYKPVELTPKGQKMAQHARERHETVVRFLLALGVDTKTAQIDAEGIEHHVSPKTLRAMERFVKAADK